jgi:putative FmdB family regulatory protein
MPIYEYRCSTCGSRQSKFWRSMSAVKEDTLTCAKCGSKKLSRLVSRVRMVRGGGSADESAAGGSGGDGMGMDESLMREMESMDENDPRALGRLMRKMAAASGEDLGPEFGEVVGRLEKGEDPENIERDMGDVFGGDAGMGMDGTGDMAGAPGGAEVTEPVQPRTPRVSRRKPAVKPAATSAAKTPAHAARSKAGAAKSGPKRAR